MKIRMGFVSNSSSSSYIVAITRNFILPEKLKEELMGQYSEHLWGDEGECPPVEDIVALALDNICSQKTIWHENCPAAVHALIDVISDDDDLSKRHYIERVDAGPDEGKYINLLCDGEKEEFFEKKKYILESNCET